MAITPETWRVRITWDTSISGSVYKYGFDVETSGGFIARHIENEYDANLIAAAPEMLEALKTD